MGRAGYSDDLDQWDLIRWRGAVASGIRGARGQQALCDMLEVLDDMPEKKLVSNELACEDGVCALGALAQKRGLDVSKIDPEDTELTAQHFSLSHAMVCEIVYINDDCGWHKETPEQRFIRVRAWVESQIKKGPDHD